MIGTNRDLKSMQRILDCRIVELKRLASTAPEPAWIPGRLAALRRERVAVGVTLVNRRTEAAKNVVDLSRWFNGNGALFGRAVHRAAEHTGARPERLAGISDYRGDDAHGSSP